MKAVFGSTGETGRAAAQALTESGKKVRWVVGSGERLRAFGHAHKDGFVADAEDAGAVNRRRALFAVVTVVYLLAGATIGVACARAEREGTDAASAPASAGALPRMHSVASAAAHPPLLRAAGELVSLPVSGFGAATVSVPLGAAERRPVVVGVHGHGIRPEEACESWRRATYAFPFVLCPHGLPADAGPDAVVTLGSAKYTAREIEAGLAALKARFGAHVAEEPVIFAGFSLGARLGVSIVAASPERYPLIVLGEGGYQQLTRRLIGQYAKAGIERILLVCSTDQCEISYEPVSKRLRNAGIESRIASSGGAVHRFRGEVVEATRRNWPWLVRDASGYQGFRP